MLFQNSVQNVSHPNNFDCNNHNFKLGRFISIVIHHFIYFIIYIMPIYIILHSFSQCTVQPEASLPNKTTSHVEGKGDRHSKQFYPLNNFPTIDYQTFLINYLYGSGNPAFPR